MGSEMGCGRPSCRGTSGQINHAYCRDCAPWCACGNRREECDGNRAGCVRPANIDATGRCRSCAAMPHTSEHYCGCPPTPEQAAIVSARAGLSRPLPPAGLDTTAMRAVLDEVAAERARQHARWGQQDLPDGTGQPSDRDGADSAREACAFAASHGGLTYRHILDEEVAEVMAETEPARLRTELVQVAAVAVQWIEGIDRRAKIGGGR